MCVAWDGVCVWYGFWGTGWGMCVGWLGMGYVMGSYVCSWELRVWWGVTFVAGNYVCGGELRL